MDDLVRPGRAPQGALAGFTSQSVAPASAQMLAPRFYAGVKLIHQKIAKKSLKGFFKDRLLRAS